jgi:hypothetical protein
MARCTLYESFACLLRANAFLDEQGGFGQARHATMTAGGKVRHDSA